MENTEILEKKEKKSKKKFVISRIIFLIVLLSANTFAWFIYVTRIDNSVSVHVKAWDVLFQDGDEEISTNVELTVEDLYPGMVDYLYEITAYNNSEVSAYLTYTIIEANVLGTTYVTTEGRAERGQSVQQGDLTSAQLANKLNNDYPFSISFSISNSVIGSEDGEETYSLSANWPYESNDDEEDTRWGVLASTYKKSHPSSPSITLLIKLSITQSNS